MHAENRIPKAVFRVFVVALLVLGGIIGALLAVDVWIARRVRGNQDRVRQLMRAFMRVRVTKWYADATRNSAGKRHSPYALLSHVGRRSGKPYQTTLGATAYGDGFVLPTGIRPPVRLVPECASRRESHAGMARPDI